MCDPVIGRIRDMPPAPVEAMEFSRAMMRLEYSIKTLGCVEKERGETVAVNWSCYVDNRVPEDIFEKLSAKDCVAFLIAEPPRRQVFRNGQLGFEDRGLAISDIRSLLIAVKTIRNNLFHGGKEGDVGSERNKTLYKAGLVIIDGLLDNDNDLRNIFFGQ